MENELNTLHRQRGQIKRKVTDFQKFIDNLKQRELTNVEIKELENRLARVIPLLDDIELIQNNILKLEINLQSEEDYISEFEQSYYQVVAEGKVLVEQFVKVPDKDGTGTLGAASSMQRVSSNNVHVLNSVKLPIISLPKFKGQFTMWLEFHDTFSSLIHENESLSQVQKFHYLRASLEGDAADVIKSLSMSAANYIIAWNLLCDRFTNKKLLLQHHLSEIFQIKEINKESASNLREISDTVTKHLRSLETLGLPVSEWDAMIIYLITSKLDKRTLRDWESLRSNEELPTLEEILSFLNARADVLDNINTCQGDSRIQRDKPRLNKSFLSSNISCFFCKQPHAIYQCSQFLALPISERIKKVRELKLCSNCLRNSHTLKDCDMRSRTCKICKRNHNTLLHIKVESGQRSGSDQTQNNDATEATDEVSLSARTSSNIHVLLATALVKIKDKDGRWLDGRVLLDSASQSNFVTKDFFLKLGIHKSNVNISIQGINQITSPIRHQCIVTLKSQVSQFTTNLKCLILDKISDNLPSESFMNSEWPIPPNLQLADPTYATENKIDLLIGAQLFWSLLLNGQIRLGPNLPILQNSQFGWILSGPCPRVTTREMSHCFLSNTIDVQRQLQEFWELEEFPRLKPLSVEEQMCEDYFNKTVTRDKIGRYIVSIPFKISPEELGKSKAIALRRFQALERKLNANPILKKSYVEFINDYQILGHMSKVSNPEDNMPHYYIPHHGVINEASVTTRLRVVFDGSCATSTGMSINNLQMVGPSFQSTLFTILIRFRQHNIVFCADIQKMYRQILIAKNERQFQRILWREDSNHPVEVFELNTVTYGTASAPYLATRCLKHIADEYQSQYPEAAAIIKSDFYVDDIISGGNSVEHVVTLCNQIASILTKAHFPLHKWASNDPHVLHQIKASTATSSIIQIGAGNMVKTLGLYWFSAEDLLRYKVDSPMQSENVTKRQILSTISQIFDPLGLLSPCVIIGKILLQSLWQEKIEWDDVVSEPLRKKWRKFQEELVHLNVFEIDRKILCSDLSDVELHGFADASEVAYSACVYARSTDLRGQVFVNLICAKAKVAPLKRVTVPRLELCAAHLLSKLINVVRISLRVHINKVYNWSDSTIVLGWLKTSPSVLKMFVSHRVAEIQASSKDCTWLHVPTSMNPADLGSRGVFPRELKESRLWWRGPAWLQLQTQDWPAQTHTIQLHSESLPEIKRVEVSYLLETREFILNISDYSSYSKLVRVVAFILRFIKNCKLNKARRITGSLSVKELHEALMLIIRFVQEIHFSKEIRQISANQKIKGSKLLNLNPFLDDSGILRVGGRLHNSHYALEKRHQIVLPKEQFTRLLFQHEHIRLCHAGPQLLLASMRDRFWPLSGRNEAKAIVRSCVVCFRCKPVHAVPQMGNLPLERVSPSFPFENVGVDYAGPLLIKNKIGRGCKLIKGYIALFICFATKAVHVELVSDLTTQGFLLALQRFVSRRGKPKCIYSDNGSNFIGASKELRQVIKNLMNEKDTLNDSSVLEGVSWSFIPPNSPHFGGLWEAGVKRVKHHLKRMTMNLHLTFEQMCTLLAQIEAILNSRPLFPMSADPSDLEPITPSHFLIGRKLTTLPTQDLMQIPTYKLSNYKRLQQLMQSFWKRWGSEYLHELQQRKKWTTSSPNIKVGTMVLMQSEGSPPYLWPIGRITEVFPGPDNLVRVVNVRTNKGIYKRAVTKIFPLPNDY